MLVVTSNWALGDGTLVPAAAAWHGMLSAAIHRAVLRAGVRGDGSYRPIDRLDLVLAGDTFDWLSSSEWQSELKPWHGTAAAREAAARVARRSIQSARRLLGPVIHWARQGLPVPAATRGRPGRMQVNIPVRVTLLAGDRDAAVDDYVGRRHDRQPVTVGSRWDDGRVTVRHGHDLDPACRPAGGPSTGRTATPDRAPARNRRQPKATKTRKTDSSSPWAQPQGSPRPCRSRRETSRSPPRRREKRMSVSRFGQAPREDGERTELLCPEDCSRRQFPGQTPLTPRPPCRSSDRRNHATASPQARRDSGRRRSSATACAGPSRRSRGDENHPTR